jgi:hypothetical protein
MALGTPQSCRPTLAKPQSRLPARGRHSLLDRLAQEQIHAARTPVQGAGQGDRHTHGNSLLYALGIVKHATWHVRMLLL